MGSPCRVPKRVPVETSLLRLTAEARGARAPRWCVALLLRREAIARHAQLGHWHESGRTAQRRSRVCSQRDTERAMPEEFTTPDLVELTRRTIEAANRHDLCAGMQFQAPDPAWDL